MRCWGYWLMFLLVGCSYTETTKETGHKGRARVNPYLAGERLLESYGYVVRHDPGWPELDGPLGMVVIPASVMSAEGYVAALDDWVEWGGHAVILLQNGEAYLNDWSDSGSFVSWGHENAPEALKQWMVELGLSTEAEEVRSSSTKKPVSSLKFQGVDYEVWMESSFLLKEAGREMGMVESRPRGDGRVTFVVDARPFRNRYIGDYDHAELLVSLADLSEYGVEVVFVRNASLSFWAMLWRQCWPALVALLALIAVWLWKNLPRFGPLDTHEDVRGQRSYDHHLEALGGFHWRLDRGQGLLKPMRDGLLERTQTLAIASGHRDADLFQIMADRSGLTRERAERAMTFERARDSANFTRLVADLQIIHTSIP